MPLTRGLRRRHVFVLGAFAAVLGLGVYLLASRLWASGGGRIAISAHATYYESDTTVPDVVDWTAYLDHPVRITTFTAIYRDSDGHTLLQQRMRLGNRPKMVNTIQGHVDDLEVPWKGGHCFTVGSQSFTITLYVGAPQSRNAVAAGSFEDNQDPASC